VTLAIWVEYRNESTGQLVSEHWNAGFEDDRRLLWGAAPLKALGLRLLPQIECDATYEDHTWNELLGECAVLENWLAQSNGDHPNQSWIKLHGERLLSYLNNIRLAIEFAKVHAARDIRVE
jgi:hypothetical protein